MKEGQRYREMGGGVGGMVNIGFRMVAMLDLRLSWSQNAIVKTQTKGQGAKGKRRTYVKRFCCEN